MTARAFIIHSLWIGFLVGLLGLTGGILISRTMMRPACPTEDSCTVNYQHGGWYVGGERVSK